MRQFFLVFLLLAGLISCAQNTEDINVKEVERIEHILASDEMKGRQAGTPGSEKAALFIAEEFKKAGLSPLNKGKDNLQPFKLLESKLLDVKGEMDGQELDAKKIFVLTTKADLEVDEKA